ncbi:hypothetical protein BH11PSE7_BH11PSE7_13610 [soil metagenome]
MPTTSSLASASSTTPLPSSAFVLPEAFIAAMTDQVAAMRDLLDSYSAVESLLNPAADSPPAAIVAGLLRVVNAGLVRRLASVEAMLSADKAAR